MFPKPKKTKNEQITLEQDTHVSDTTLENEQISSDIPEETNKEKKRKGKKKEKGKKINPKVNASGDTQEINFQEDNGEDMKEVNLTESTFEDVKEMSLSESTTEDTTQMNLTDHTFEDAKDLNLQENASTDTKKVNAKKPKKEKKKKVSKREPKKFNPQKKRFGIKLKLLLTVVPTVSAAILILLLITYQSSQKIILNLAKRTLTSESKAYTQELSVWANSIISELEMYKTAIESVDMSLEDKFQFMKKTVGRNDSYPNGIFMGSSENAFVSGSQMEENSSFAVAAEKWFQA